MAEQHILLTITCAIALYVLTRTYPELYGLLEMIVVLGYHGPATDTLEGVIARMFQPYDAQSQLLQTSYVAAGASRKTI